MIDLGVVRAAVADLLRECGSGPYDPVEFLGAQFDQGLAWVHFPQGRGGRGWDRAAQAEVNRLLEQAGAPDGYARNPIGHGMAAATIMARGDDAQHDRYLRPLWTGEEVWCQLFSEPDAGSDLAAVRTRAVRDGDGWRVTGHKVWTSLAHRARWAILLARTSPHLPKHRGMTFFVCDMHADGVTVEPLRQITGEAEFNEVFLDGVFLHDSLRIGPVDDGWRVAQTSLGNERVAIGARPQPREGGMIGLVAQLWRDQAHRRTPGLHRRLLHGWVAAEAARLASERLGQLMAVGAPGPEGSASKLAFAVVNQSLSGLALDILGPDALRFPDYTMTQPSEFAFHGKDPRWNYLRSRANSIEGGTSEVLKNVIGERILGLPREPAVDREVAFEDLPR
ncbi:acyl-CoA dehydrogenase family protein [Micromonospora sp. HUAS LYJ1]|uniref:acyl-CoA dehydrogenase family protein n=1 Tax=Micromonospora sp. HUAS LYJ1 TaxID=3061626 RepID=UPI0026733E63|nr:acyl-CoA dehydrogenase family protein [Micromonospora sp. HUAS LYJ1]WKU03535.1 acyl-CoA dehydrogenase family protein [Micromonospora sp. HUAS LYJ1]